MNWLKSLWKRMFPVRYVPVIQYREPEPVMDNRVQLEGLAKATATCPEIFTAFLQDIMRKDRELQQGPHRSGQTISQDDLLAFSLKQIELQAQIRTLKKYYHISRYAAVHLEKLQKKEEPMEIGGNWDVSDEELSDI